MILENELASIIARQREIEERKSLGQIRPLDFNDVLLDSHVLDITGVRRCGKSTVIWSIWPCGVPAGTSVALMRRENATSSSAVGMP